MKMPRGPVFVGSGFTGMSGGKGGGKGGVFAGMKYGDPRPSGGAYAGRRPVKKAVAKGLNTQASRTVLHPQHRLNLMGFGKELRKINKDTVANYKKVYKYQAKKNAAPKVPAKSSRKPAKVAVRTVRRYKAPGKA